MATILNTCDNPKPLPLLGNLSSVILNKHSSPVCVIASRVDVDKTRITSNAAFPDKCATVAGEPEAFPAQASGNLEKPRDVIADDVEGLVSHVEARRLAANGTVVGGRAVRRGNSERRVVLLPDGIGDDEGWNHVSPQAHGRDGVKALLVPDVHRDNFGLALANRNYGANFYKNGAHLNGV